MSGLNHKTQHNKAWHFTLQAINYGIFIAFIWYFSSAPSVRPIRADEGVITIAFAHAGKLREACRRLSQEELNDLAPNMRKLDDCPRERSPVRIEASLDGEIIYSEILQPQGLFGDGGVDVFYSARVPVGEHNLSLKMNDSVRVDGFNHQLEQRVITEPARILLVSYHNKFGFIIDGAENR